MSPKNAPDDRISSQASAGMGVRFGQYVASYRNDLDCGCFGSQGSGGGVGVGVSGMGAGGE